MNQSTPMKVIASDDGRENAQHDVDRSVDAQAQILGHAVLRRAVVARRRFS